MKTIEVTDDQYTVIQHLRAQMSEDIVGRYGFVRERDAIQYLIDVLDEDSEVDVDVDVNVEYDTSATDDVSAAVEAAIGNTDSTTGAETLAFDESDDIDESSETENLDDGGGEQDGSSDGSTDQTEHGEGTSDESPTEDVDGDDTGGEATDDDMLDQMMNLLETHDDKWEESPSADYRYRVTLPDGSTRDVQTKDDVRAALFKNY